jgi:hypothetical protein
VRFTYGTHEQNDHQHRDISVDHAVARTYAQRALKIAVSLNRKGDYAGAYKLLTDTMRKILSYTSADDKYLQAIVYSLDTDSKQFSQAVSEDRRKSTYSEATSSLRGRTSDGRATRR